MKILIAEDEKAMSDALAAVLKHFGYEVDAVYDGLAATEKARENSYSCIIFDIMMPKIDGIEALKRIRDSGDMTPVIMLTAKSEVGDRIMGLDAGADDYLAKPFAMGELLARIRSMTRRMGEFTPTKLKKGDVELDVAEQETKLLSYLMMNEGKTISTDELFRYVWSDETDMDIGIVWMYISYLREKIEAVHGNIRIAGEKNGDFRLQIISR